MRSPLFKTRTCACKAYHLDGSSFSPPAAGFAWARLLLACSGVVGRPLLFWLFFPLFSLVSRHSGARWDLPMPCWLKSYCELSPAKAKF